MYVCVYVQYRKIYKNNKNKKKNKRYVYLFYNIIMLELINIIVLSLYL